MPNSIANVFWLLKAQRKFKEEREAEMVGGYSGLESEGNILVLVSLLFILSVPVLWL